MAGQKNLHELLSEDQEPFLLHDYIRDRRRQLNRPPHVPALLRHRKGDLVSLSKPNTRDFCFPLHSDFCLKRLRFVGSCDPTKSPLFEFPSAMAPPRSPCHKSTVSLLVPARTAALLLEAASRIQRSSSVKLPRKRSLGTGIVGLILKRFTRRKSKPVGFGRSGDEDELWHVETYSGSSDNGLGNVEGRGLVCEQNSCKSLLPFETLAGSYPEGQWLEFLSPPASPKHFGEGNEDEPNRDTCIPKGKNVDEEEEREQFSPVSVLDPPFQVDDEDGDGHVHVMDCEEDDRDQGDVGFDYDCSYAFVQRTKQQLLDKLQRFERLARLDPVELEKRMMELDDVAVEGQSVSIEDTTPMECEGLVTIGFAGLRKSPGDISKLVEDLVAEEVGDSESSGPENKSSAISRVNKRLESWEEEPSPIDVIVDRELRVKWMRDDLQFGLLAEEIETGMFESLLEEITLESSCC